MEKVFISFICFGFVKDHVLNGLVLGAGGINHGYSIFFSMVVCMSHDLIKL